MVALQSKLIKAVDNQFDYSSSIVERIVLNELVAQSGLSPAEIAPLLGVTEVEIDPQNPGQLPNLDPNHTQLVAGVIRHGLAVFDQHVRSLIKWLRTPHPELACPQTGFFPKWPATPPPPLDDMTSSQPYDLVAYARRRAQQAVPPESSKPKRPYPTPISLLGTASGIELVDAIFGRIEWGVFM